MHRPAFKVHLRLLPTSDGGRQTSIRSDYRPSFDTGATWLGERMLTDGRIMLDRDELAPGSDAAATIEPLRPEFWDHVRAGSAIPVMEGSRVVGHATVLDRISPVAPAVAAFVRGAREFCAFVETGEELALAERLALARKLLVSLYAAGIELPVVDGVTEREPPILPPPERWRAFTDYDVYWEVFDPYEDEDAVAGSLSGDVLEIYTDVRRGLWFWDKNETPDAVWEWRFSFESHWGDHAIDALRALHRACGNTLR